MPISDDKARFGLSGLYIQTRPTSFLKSESKWGGAGILSGCSHLCGDSLVYLKDTAEFKEFVTNMKLSEGLSCLPHGWRKGSEQLEFI